ncbi:MAG: hypothetical protein JWM62_1842 [Frankiales bacterium]|nr:hypothetical protein [Frankiales bacterium]
MSRRRGTYLAIRLAAAVVLLAATVMPRGVPAGLLIMAAGVAAVLSCVAVNAGGPGEQWGARPQDRWFDSLRAPQGDWPPYEAPTTPAPTEATARPPAAS